MSRKNFGAKPLTYPQPVFIIATYDENGNAALFFFLSCISFFYPL